MICGKNVVVDMQWYVYRPTSRLTSKSSFLVHSWCLDSTINLGTRSITLNKSLISMRPPVLNVHVYLYIDLMTRGAFNGIGTCAGQKFCSVAGIYIFFWLCVLAWSLRPLREEQRVVTEDGQVSPSGCFHFRSMCIILHLFANGPCLVKTK